MYLRRVHLLQNLLREGLLDPVEVAGSASLLDALGLSLCELLNMSPCRVLSYNVSRRAHSSNGKGMAVRTKTMAIFGAIVLLNVCLVS